MTAAWGFGLTTYAADGATVLDTWFPAPSLGEKPADAAAPADLVALEGADDARGVTRKVNLVEIADLDAAPVDTVDVWLRLHLLSHRLVQPHGLSLDGQFGLLTNVVWTSAAPARSRASSSPARASRPRASTSRSTASTSSPASSTT